MKEKETNVFDIKDFKENVFNEMLRYLYTQEV